MQDDATPVCSTDTDDWGRMVTDSLSRQSLSNQLAEKIMHIILDQKLAPGKSLPSAAELAERFGVSRTVVREALADLAGRGIVERSQGRESVVATPGPDQLREMFRYRIQRDRIAPTAIMEFRQSIETESARLAATRWTEAGLDELRQAFGRMSAARNENEFHEADLAFHGTIAQLSENPLLTLTHDALVELYRDVRRRAYRGRVTEGQYPLDRVVEDHRAILVAIEKGDGQGASEAMAHHLNMTMEHLRSS